MDKMTHNLKASTSNGSIDFQPKTKEASADAMVWKLKAVITDDPDSQRIILTRFIHNHGTV
jgi:hypothetical protein